MLLVKGLFNDEEEREVLVTGGGDGAIKLWKLSESDQLKLIAEYENDGLNVLSMAFSGLFLYAGMSDGLVLVYDLSSNQLVHKFQAGAEDVTSIQVLAGMPLVGTSVGRVTQFNTQFTEVETWHANAGKILATSLARCPRKDLFLTAGNDDTIAFWDVSDLIDLATPMTPHGNDDMIQSLREFVSYRTVAATPKYASDCHEAVAFLRKLFTLFNVQSVSLLPTGDGINPILLAHFKASDCPKEKRTILFYGHYDVVDAEMGKENGEWASDPFKLRPSNGYLYGRGVTDNKSPILCAMFAVAELANAGLLSCNIVFLLEGEEEAGSRKLQETVREHRTKIGSIDYIIASNSYWLEDNLPCLTYGMRGVIHATISVSSGKPDQHSGMDGKVSQNEPLKDITMLVAALSGSTARTVQIPHFYKNVRDRRTRWEDQQYEFIAEKLMQGHPELTSKSKFVKSLEERWSEPNLSVHSITSESKTAVTIAGSAQAKLSIRIVPNQKAKEIADLLTRCLKDIFERSGSTNKLDVSINSLADPWLADPMSQPFNTLSKAVSEVWHPQEELELRSLPSLNASSPQQYTQPALKRPTHRRASSLATDGFFKLDDLPKAPLFIREGGSIPAIAFLEKEFDAKAAMFPMGQASDNAHLDNERMRVLNLYNGKAVLKKVFAEL
jgi:di- and tripeptidase